MATHYITVCPRLEVSYGQSSFGGNYMWGCVCLCVCIYIYIYVSYDCLSLNLITTYSLIYWFDVVVKRFNPHHEFLTFKKKSKQKPAKIFSHVIQLPLILTKVLDLNKDFEKG